MLRYLIASLFCLLLLPLAAQEELGVHFLRGTWQAAATNPAFTPEGDLNINLPDFYADYYLSDLTVNAALGTNAEGEPAIDIREVRERLGPNNIIRENQAIGTLGIGKRVGSWYFSFSHQWRETGLALYPEAMPRLIWEGNANALGEEMDVSSDIALTQFHEWSLGVAYQLTPGLVVGTRLNILGGVHDFSVEKPQLSLHTNELDYSLSLDADFLVNTSGNFNYEGVDSITTGWQAFNMDPGMMFGPNLGVSFDIGVNYEKNGWDASMSVLNMGSIGWKGEVNNYRIQGLKSFSGIDVLDSLFQGATNIGSIFTTVNEALDVEESEEKYTTKLPVRLYASLGYRLNEDWHFGALYFQEWQRGKVFPAAALSANVNMNSWLDLGAVYSWRAGTFSNLGLNASFLFGGFRIVAATDSLLGLVNWQNSYSGNFRLGFNLVL